MEKTFEMINPTLVQRLARRQLFAVAGQLTGAGITLSEGDSEYFFGDRQAPLQAQIQVLDPAFYWRVLLGGSVASGETWGEQLWTTDDLTRVVRVFARNYALLDKLEQRMGWLSMPLNKMRHFARRNCRTGSRSNIAAHYDLGNEMYGLFLDPLMQYSSAIFDSPSTSLAEAQQNKLRSICDKLELKPTDHLLEIGTGWGGLAYFAAEHYGCRVTSTTLSQAQYEYASQLIADAGLSDRVTLLLKDYRDISGQYDKLVSVEMIEAVGHQYLPVYFETLNRLLKPHGQLLIQAITIADQRYGQYRNNMDFIQRYIFPGGCLPCVSEMCKQLNQQTDMTLTRLTSHGHDYAATLKAWANNFQAAAGTLQQQGYNEMFQRFWQFYFAYSAGGFLEGAIDLIHFEAAKPAARICHAG